MRDFEGNPFAEKLEAGQRVTLSDSATKVVFVTDSEGYRLQIDHGLYEDRCEERWHHLRPNLDGDSQAFRENIY